VWIYLIATAIVGVLLAIGIRWGIRYTLSGSYKVGEIADIYRPKNFSLPEPELVEFVGEKETTLRGRFWRGSSNVGIVIVHGIDGPSIEMMPHAAYLVRDGYNVLVYDNRGRGRSDGGFSTLGFLEWKDVLHAVQWMRNQESVDPNRVGLHGLSLGAACVIMAAAVDTKIQGVIAESPFVSMTIMLSHVANKLTRLPRFLIGGLLNRVLDLSLGTRLRLVEPHAAVSKISPRPIFIIDAEQDQLFPEDTSQTVYEAAEEPKQFWKVSGAKHANCWHTRPEEFEQRVLAFWKMVFEEEVIMPQTKSDDAITQTTLPS